MNMDSQKCLIVEATNTYQSIMFSICVIHKAIVYLVQDLLLYNSNILYCVYICIYCSATWVIITIHIWCVYIYRIYIHTHVYIPAVTCMMHLNPTYIGTKISYMVWSGYAYLISNMPLLDKKKEDESPLTQYTPIQTSAVPLEKNKDIYSILFTPIYTSWLKSSATRWLN